MVRCWELNSLSRDRAASAIASKSSRASMPIVAKAHAVLARFWALNSLSRDRAASAIASKSSRASMPDFAKRAGEMLQLEVLYASSARVGECRHAAISAQVVAPKLGGAVRGRGEVARFESVSFAREEREHALRRRARVRHQFAPLDLLVAWCLLWAPYWLTGVGTVLWS